MPIELGNFNVQELILAGDQGVCGGVRMADVVTRTALEKVNGRRPVVALWDVIHNVPYMEEMRSLGLTTIDNWVPIEARQYPLPEKIRRFLPKRSISIMPAHGSYLELYTALEDTEGYPLDTTCQLVSRVQREAERAVKRGEHVIYIGVEGHPETNSVIKRLDPEFCTLIDAREAKAMSPGARINYLQNLGIPPEQAKLICNQTTLSLGDLKDIKSWLTDNYQGFVSLSESDTCYAMEYLWHGVADMTEQRMIDALIVVGSKHSHNSQELRNKGEDDGIPSYSVDGPDEVDLNWFNPKITKVGITSGASVFPKYRDALVDWFLQRNSSINVTQLLRREKDRIFKYSRERIDGIEDFIQQTAA